MAKFDISNNSFFDQSSVIHEYHESSLCEEDWVRIETDLLELRAKLSGYTELTQAVTELTEAVRERRLSPVKNTASKYALEFASATFANLASGAVLGLIGL